MEKVAEAQRLLSTMPPSDKRYRLLRLAVVRRDGPLLEGLMPDEDTNAPHDTEPPTTR